MMRLCMLITAAQGVVACAVGDEVGADVVMVILFW